MSFGALPDVGRTPLRHMFVHERSVRPRVVGARPIEIMRDSVTSRTWPQTKENMQRTGGKTPTAAATRLGFFINSLRPCLATRLTFSVSHSPSR